MTASPQPPSLSESPLLWTPALSSHCYDEVKLLALMKFRIGSPSIGRIETLSLSLIYCYIPGPSTVPAKGHLLN